MGEEGQRPFGYLGLVGGKFVGKKSRSQNFSGNSFFVHDCVTPTGVATLPARTAATVIITVVAVTAIAVTTTATIATTTGALFTRFGFVDT